MRVLRKLTLLETIPHLISLSLLSINDVRKDAVACHDKVYHASKRKNVRLNTGFKWIVSRAEKSARLSTPAFQNDLPIF